MEWQTRQRLGFGVSLVDAFVLLVSIGVATPASAESCCVRAPLRHSW